MFGKKKKTWFVKFFIFKNHVLGIKIRTSFSKYNFSKKHGKKMSYDLYIYIYIYLLPSSAWSLKYVPAFLDNELWSNPSSQF